MPKIVHPGTSKVFELIPMEQFKHIQKLFPDLKRLKRRV